MGTNKRGWLQELDAASGQADARPSTLYQPDELDGKSNQFVLRFFLNPHFKCYEPYNQLSDANKKKLRE